MNKRLKLTDISARLTAQVVPSVPGLVVGTSLDKTYLQRFADPTYVPALWVVAQRYTPKDDGRGFSSHMRQNVGAELLVRAVVAKFLPAPYNAETVMEDLVERTSNALCGWAAPEATKSFAWGSSIDGPVHDVVLIVDMVFVAEVVYVRTF